MTVIRWSRTSLGNIEDIRDYLVGRNPGAARRVIRLIRERAKLLKEYPELSPAVDDTGVRKALVTGLPYILLYQYRDGIVDILRVRHAAEDWRA